MAKSYILVHHSGEIINTKEGVIFRNQNPQNMGSVIHATSPHHVNMARSTDADQVFYGAYYTGFEAAVQHKYKNIKTVIKFTNKLNY